MWIIVTFSIVFVALLRASQPALFREAQRALDPMQGLVLTLALVTSGWFAAVAVHACRAKRFLRARSFYGAAVAGGLLFVGLRLRDYAALVSLGHRLGSDDFWDA